MGGKETSGGGAFASLRCFKCGEVGHNIVECMSTIVTYLKCREPRHDVVECSRNVTTCFNNGEPGHISYKCSKLKNSLDAAQGSSKVFSLSGVEVSRYDNLIQGTHLINSAYLITIINTSVKHSFISLNCATKLSLVVSSMSDSMVIDTLTYGLVTNSSVCLNCPLTIYGIKFRVNLICLPLSRLDVILEMI